jgi:lantibiotic modifying enzyme
VIGGAAGAAFALLVLHRAQPSDLVSDALRHAGKVLAARTPSRTIGFSHGATSYACALAGVAARLDEQHHLDQALAALDANPPGAADPGLAHGWCEGAAGATLGRAYLLTVPGDGTRAEPPAERHSKRPWEPFSGPSSPARATRESEMTRCATATLG